MAVKDVDFFKEKNLDEKTLNQIVQSASYEYIPKGKFAFREGEKGDCLYLVLSGEAHALIVNKDYL